MIAAYRGKSWVSKMIRWQTRSEYSHIAWVEPDMTTFEAWVSGGVAKNATPWSVHTPGTWIDFYNIETLTAVQYLAIREFLERTVGSQYDRRGVLRFLTRKPAVLDEKWFCSELVFAACLAAGVELLARTEPWEVSPGMLIRSPLLSCAGSATAPETRIVSFFPPEYEYRPRWAEAAI